MMTPALIIPPRERITYAIQGAPLHLRPIWAAVRDHGVDHILVMQGCEPFRLPNRRHPLLMLIGDDMYVSRGPAGFPRKALRRAVSNCDAALIVAGKPDPEEYQGAATFAALSRLSVAIVETRPEHADDWVTFLRSANPNIAVRQ
ncbi:hypothetical protein ACO2Q3_22660 [Caulobacter sp. KR2-114]|uniref:hypothetical protein n=1 Tax=Caulobacter sp. KR2-114 TaxID=3400912 RepID=UPI003C01A4C3